MATTYTLTAPGITTVTSAGYPDGALIYNEASTGTVYASDRPGGETPGFPITPLGSLTWGQGRPLYLSTDTTGTRVTVDTDSSSSLSLPSAIASQILDQGLAQQIAAAINVQGVPVIDQPDQIVNVQGATIPTGGEQLPMSDPLDVSKYSSVMFFFYCARKDGTTPDSSDTVEWSINNYFAQSAADAKLWTTAYTASGHCYSVISGAAPVTGDYMNLTCLINAADPSVYSVNAVVIGSLKTVPDYVYQCTNTVWEGLATATPYGAFERSTSWSDEVAAGATVELYPSHASGRMMWSWRILLGGFQNTAGSYLGIAVPENHTYIVSGAMKGDPITTDTTYAVHAYDVVPIGNKQPVLHVNNTNTAAMTYEVTMGWE